MFFIFHWLAMSNSCYNPFIYGIYSVSCRRSQYSAGYSHVRRKSSSESSACECLAAVWQARLSSVLTSQTLSYMRGVPASPGNGNFIVHRKNLKCFLSVGGHPRRLAGWWLCPSQSQPYTRYSLLTMGRKQDHSIPGGCSSNMRTDLGPLISSIVGKC